MFSLFFASQVLAEKDQASKIFEQVRCPSCVAQTVSDSNTVEAKKIRALILERLAQGKQEGEILDEVVTIYGEQVLMQSRTGIALWFAPVLIFLMFVVLGLRRLAFRANR